MSLKMTRLTYIYKKNDKCHSAHRQKASENRRVKST